MDLNNLSKKLDLESLVANVKSLINPEEGAPQPEQGDKIGELLAECSHLARDISTGHKETAKNLDVLANKLNLLYKELHKPVPEAKAEGGDKAGEAEAQAQDTAKAQEPKVEQEAPSQDASNEQKSA